GGAPPNKKKKSKKKKTQSKGLTGAGENKSVRHSTEKSFLLKKNNSHRKTYHKETKTKISLLLSIRRPITQD
ncbi:hypothetical protein ACQWB2_24905, partial [Salmonella enterica subsp. enterica serovar Infantis]